VVTRTHSERWKTDAVIDSSTGLPARRRGLPAQAASLAVTVVLMWVAGAVLGLLWQWWSPAGPAGFVVSPGQVQPDETEAFIAGDGRYAAIAIAVGIAAALILWFGRIGRGIPAVLALAVGGLGGAAATAAVGHAVRGDGSTYRCGSGASSCINHLALSVHAHGLWLVEAAAAVLVYGLCVAFAKEDDLGLPDPAREQPTGSVGADVELQHSGRHRDRVGEAQERDLPPQ
jgi:hypothetical protein